MSLYVVCDMFRSNDPSSSGASSRLDVKDFRFRRFTNFKGCYTSNHANQTWPTPASINSERTIPRIVLISFFFSLLLSHSRPMSFVRQFVNVFCSFFWFSSFVGRPVIFVLVLLNCCYSYFRPSWDGQCMLGFFLLHHLLWREFRHAHMHSHDRHYANHLTSAVSTGPESPLRHHLLLSISLRIATVS